jgi:glycosyltransferase involved in cell wall biosynthesis
MTVPTQQDLSRGTAGGTLRPAPDSETAPAGRPESTSYHEHGSARRPAMHVITTANKPHGGFKSACGLMSRLRGHFEVFAWSVYPGIPEALHKALEDCADHVGDISTLRRFGAGEHALFYLNDYPPVFTNYASMWQRTLADCDSVQLVFNRTLGGFPFQHWLAQRVDTIYFHDTAMRDSWDEFTEDSPLNHVPTRVLAPPVDLSAFLDLPMERAAAPLVIGRLAGDPDVPRNAVEFYGQLAERLPEARFWFMPAPEALRQAFAGNPRFRFINRDGIGVGEFLSACHIYLLTYDRLVPVPGPRSLMEAMAAGCAPVVIDRHGPRDRVEHGVSGLRSNDDAQMIDQVASLAGDANLRARIAEGARRRAAGFGPQAWIDAIVSTTLDPRRAKSPVDS